MVGGLRLKSKIRRALVVKMSVESVNGWFTRKVMSGFWNELRRVLFVAVWGVLSLGVEGEEVKVHAINGIVEMRLDSKWNLKAAPTRASGGRLISVALLNQKGAEEIEMIVHFALEMPRQDLVILKPEKMAEVASKNMLSLITAKGMKAGRILVTQSKVMGNDYWLFQNEVKAEDLEKATICGVVWNTDRRTYSLISLSEGKAHPVGFWHDIVKGWKEVTKEEKVYAETYQIRSKFLSKEQLKKLPDVLNKEWGVSLELAGMLEKLEKKETAAKRAEYVGWLEMAEARKMRLIYHHVLTAEQKKKFEASVKRRMEEAK